MQKLSAAFRSVRAAVRAFVLAGIAVRVVCIVAVAGVVCVAGFVFIAVIVVHRSNTILSLIECAETYFLYKNLFYEKVLRKYDGMLE